MRSLRFIVLALILAGCSDTRVTAVQPYDQFLATLAYDAPLPALDISAFPPQQQCTPFPDNAPYRQTIQSALDFIATRIDPSFLDEAMAFLDGGVVYQKLEVDRVFPYSAFFSRRTILLYDKLFEYGCLEDVVSTLVHELVHAVQQSRFRKPGVQSGEHSLVGQNRDKTIAELTADAYQIHVSQVLRLAGKVHAERIVAVNNTRRRQFNDS